MPTPVKEFSSEYTKGMFEYGNGSSNIISGRTVSDPIPISRLNPGLVIVTLVEIWPVPVITVVKPICWIDVVAALTIEPASAETNVCVYCPPARTAFAAALWNEWR